MVDSMRSWGTDTGDGTVSSRMRGHFRLEGQFECKQLGDEHGEEEVGLVVSAMCGVESLRHDEHLLGDGHSPYVGVV